MKSRFLALAILVVLVGCAPRAAVQKNVPGATPSPTPQVKTLVDIHPPVQEAEYHAALARIGNEDVNAGNIPSYSVVAQYHYNHSDLDNALKNYQKITARSNGQEVKAQYMVGQVYYDKKDYLPALAAFNTVMMKYPGSPYAAQSDQMTEFTLDYLLGLDDLRNFVKNYPDSPLACSALFQLGNREAQAGSTFDASKHLGDFLSDCPKHPSAQAARQLIQSLQAPTGTKTWRIGVLIPMTGRYKGFGESVLHGITLAVEQADHGGGAQKSIVLVVRDTMGDPIKAAKIFKDLTADDTLDAIIGPVLPSEIGVVASLANDRKIPLLCPSNPRDGLSTLGPYLFGNSMTNEMQGRAMAKYAIEKLGLRRFGILAPDDTDSNSYGSTLAQSFADTVKSMGGTIIATEMYQPNTTDFKEPLATFGGQDPTAAKEGDRENKRRMEELAYNLDKEIKKILLKARSLAVTLTPTMTVTATVPVAVVSAPSTIATKTPTATPVPPPPTAMAFIPVPEAFGNTEEPSTAKDVETMLRDSLKERKELPLRNDDLVRQALTLLPKGSPFPDKIEQLSEVAQDMQASLVITAQVVGTNDIGETSKHRTWDYTVQFQAMQFDPVKRKFVKIYQNKVSFNLFKAVGSGSKVEEVQALYVPGHSAVEIPQLASQVHFYNLNPVLLGGHLWENESVRQEGAKDVEGSYFTTGFYVDSQQGTTKHFSEEYLKRFTQRPNLLAAQAYDAANLMLKATLTASGREDIRANLTAITNFDCVTGTTNFAGKGEAEKQVPILKIQNGKLEQVQ